MKRNKRHEDFFKLGKLMKAKGITPVGFDPLHSLVTSEFHIDIMAMDSMIPNYDGDKCTYKGKPNYSMAMAIKEEWGAEIHELIKGLI